jgi:hypothetical protein
MADSSERQEVSIEAWKASSGIMDLAGLSELLLPVTLNMRGLAIRRCI